MQKTKQTHHSTSGKTDSIDPIDPIAPLANLLRRLSRKWESWLGRSDTPAQADAIIVLAGGNGQREVQASWLYHQGYAPTVVISCAFKEILGYYIDIAALSRRLLRHYGVPSDAILIQSERVRSTYDEAMGCAGLAQKYNWTTIIIVSDIYHTRRASLTFRQALRHLSVQVLVVPGERWLAHSADFSLETIFYTLALETGKVVYYRGRNRFE